MYGEMSFEPPERFTFEDRFGSGFRDAGPHLMFDMIDRVVEEHQRDMEMAIEERNKLKTTLNRVVLYMKNSLYPREKELHERLQKMTEAYQGAATGLHKTVHDITQKASTTSAQGGHGAADLADGINAEILKIDYILGNRSPRSVGAFGSPGRMQQRFGRSPSPQRQWFGQPQLSAPSYPTTPVSSSFARPNDRPRVTATFGSPTAVALEPGATIESLFDHCDTNQDGVLTREEFRQGMTSRQGSSIVASGEVRSQPGSASRPVQTTPTRSAPPVYDF